MSRPHAIHVPLVVLVLVIASLALLFNWTVIGRGGDGREADDRVAPGSARSPVVAWTSQLRGEVLEIDGRHGVYGGLGRIVAGFDRLRLLHENLLVVVDGGSVTPGRETPDRLAARAVYHALVEVGADALNIGRGEQHLDAEALEGVAAEIGIPFVSLNVVRLDGSPIDQRYVILRRGGNRVLVTGVATEIPSAGRVRTLRVIDPLDAARAFARELGELEVTHAILLADVPPVTLRRLSSLETPFNVVLGGPKPIEPTGSVSPAAFAVSGSGGIGVVRLSRVLDFQRLYLDGEVEPGRRVEGIVADYLLDLERMPGVTTRPERVRSRGGGSTFGMDESDGRRRPEERTP